MNNTNELYSLWLSKVNDSDVLEELKNINGNEEEITDRFWRNLSFGTGGLRGVLGAGTNRLNIYTVAQATQGLANFLNDDFNAPCVVIGYDSRINSEKFAKTAASVLAANGIKVYIFREIMPTPIVAFAVRELKCSSGIVITASHNPAKYNGYKCYDKNGYQMTDEAAKKTLEYINNCDIFEDVKSLDFEKALSEGAISYINDDILEKYYSLVISRCINPDIVKTSDLSVIYTPLNGAGNKPVRKILDLLGVKDITVVKSQEQPDGNFPTCPYPNPEIKEAFNEAFKTAENKKADLLLATDPDSDRVGIAVKHNGEYKLLSGNDVGCLLTDYILSQKKQQGTLCENPIIIKSIVTSDLATKIAESYGAKVYNFLTGFKYIGEKMTELEEQGEIDRFELGFEESYGYLTGKHTRDKDAVNASMIICEMTAFYKKQGKTLCDVLQQLHNKFGFWQNSLFNFAFEGADGMTKMLSIMDSIRENTPTELAGKKIAVMEDYNNSISTDISDFSKKKLDLPKSNVIILVMENKDKVIIRPSGTEPKIKLYIMAQGKCENCAKAQTDAYKNDVMKLLGIGG